MGLNDILQSFQTCAKEGAALFAAAETEESLEVSRVDILGRKGKLAELMKSLATLSDEEKRQAGVAANEAKLTLETAFNDRTRALRSALSSQKAEAEWIDVTLPATAIETGHLHLTTQAIEEITNIFARLGFVRTRHPEVDWDYYAFEALNMPANHPARDQWETFFVAGPDDEVMTGEKGKVVLTPHTSNAQVREMEKGKLPIRIINIGKTYRRQSSARHLTMFHQFDGLMIDENLTVTNLKGVIEYYVKNFFGENRQTRLRPHHFRFTEPSFELDISCAVCDGTGKVDGVKCKLCKEGWLELGGSGMVHPNVLRAGGLDPEKYTGFAFGWGVERNMIMRSGLNVDDIRVVYRNDLRFIRQF